VIINRSLLRFAVLLGGLWIGFSSTPVWADDSVQPYIDHLKKEDGIPSAPADNNGSVSPYIDSLKSKSGAPAGDDSEGYSNKIKAFLDKKDPSPTQSPSYTEEKKATLGPANDTGAIQAVKDGHSDLKYDKKGEIKYAIGLRFGIGINRDIVANNGVGTSTKFPDIYGANYAPDFALYAEYYLFRGDVGKLGVFGMAGAGIFNGFGTFQVPPLNAQVGGTFTNASQVQLHYIELPGVIGFDYRFSLSKYVQPFIMAGPSLIAGFETRNDGGSTLHVLSEGGYGAVGISVLMDWVSRHDDWDRYQTDGFIHAYLDIQYTQLKTFAGDVTYSVGGPSLGVTFEY
jgi:hypothetical protein